MENNEAKGFEMEDMGMVFSLGVFGLALIKRMSFEVKSGWIARDLHYSYAVDYDEACRISRRSFVRYRFHRAERASELLAQNATLKCTCLLCAGQANNSIQASSAEHLFNARPEFSEPTWSNYSSLRVGGCGNTEDGEIEGCLPRDSADFFTIYGCFKIEGDCEAIADFDTLNEAIAIAQQFSRDTGLPFDVDC